MRRPLELAALAAAIVVIFGDRAIDWFVRRALRLGGIHLP